MLLLRLKKCVSYTQMQQFVTIHMHNRTQAKKKVIYHWTGFKYPNLSNQSLAVHRLYHTNPEKEDRFILRPLIWEYRKFGMLQFITVWIRYFIIRFNIDNEFNYTDFYNGSKQATKVIFDALVHQNYNALDGMVRERTVKLLKHRMEALTPNQRKIFNGNSYIIIFVPLDITIKKLKDKDEKIIQIKMVGLDMIDMDENSYGNGLVYIAYSYTFQRKYICNVGGPWTVTRLSYHV